MWKLDYFTHWELCQVVDRGSKKILVTITAVYTFLCIAVLATFLTLTILDIQVCTMVHVWLLIRLADVVRVDCAGHRQDIGSAGIATCATPKFCLDFTVSCVSTPLHPVGALTTTLINALRPTPHAPASRIRAPPAPTATGAPTVARALAFATPPTTVCPAALACPVLATGRATGAAPLVAMGHARATRHGAAKIMVRSRRCRVTPPRQRTNSERAFPQMATPTVVHLLRRNRSRGLPSICASSASACSFSCFTLCGCEQRTSFRYSMMPVRA